jgi:hypothetical protein
MTRQSDCILSDQLLDLITDQGLDAMPELIRVLINQAMLSERERKKAGRAVRTNRATSWLRQWLQT